MPTILIVDDEPTNRDLLHTLLAYGGHRLFEAADGAEALAQTRRERPDLIIADILMPTMDGYEFVRQLRSDPSIAATPVIFYTAHYLERGARDLARRCGVQFILTKPTDPETLLQTVAAALGQAPQATPAPPPDVFDREHLQLLGDTLSHKVEELETTNRRLGALVEVTERLASERDPERLLEGVARAARGVVGARHAMIAVRTNGNGTWQFVLTSGLAPDIAASMTGRPVTDGALGRLLNAETQMRLTAAEMAAVPTGLPAGYPASDSLLAVRVASPQRIYGWLCLTGKLGAAEFSSSDARLAATIASLAGRVYENGSLYREVVRTAEQLGALNDNLEHRVAERTAQLDVAMRELESFSYSVSHDLRSPLRHIEGFASALLEDHAAELSAEGQRYLDRIHAGTQRMSQLIDDLLHLARVARHDMRHTRISLSDLATSVVAELRAAAPARTVTVEIAPDLSADGDAHLARILLVNLLGNAWKYTSKRADGHIVFGATQHDRERVYFVRDNGAGFDPAFLDRLFIPFKRLHSASEFEGTGIGLAIVQRIVTRHGGRVWAEGAPNRGATFYFTLDAPTDAGDRSDA